MPKYLNRPPRDATECRGDPDAEGRGIPEAPGGIPRWEEEFADKCKNHATFESSDQRLDPTHST